MRPKPIDKTQATYGMAAPGWITLSADKKTLYVVNNNGNSVTPVDVGTDTPGKPVPVGYFPYAAEQVGSKLQGLANSGVTEIVYQPCGPDVRRELERFLEAASSSATAIRS